jgi:hypothetical protein
MLVTSLVIQIMIPPIQIARAFRSRIWESRDSPHLLESELKFWFPLSQVSSLCFLSAALNIWLQYIMSRTSKFYPALSILTNMPTFVCVCDFFAFLWKRVWRRGGSSQYLAFDVVVINSTLFIHERNEWAIFDTFMSPHLLSPHQYTTIAIL